MARTVSRRASLRRVAARSCGQATLLPPPVESELPEEVELPELDESEPDDPAVVEVSVDLVESFEPAELDVEEVDFDRESVL
ncbi:MAG: hypothetical protein JO214_03775 [Frankiaceae bacterium]|nr:hypothetical protein [Frankiaceae bacterium]